MTIEGTCVRVTRGGVHPTFVPFPGGVFNPFAGRTRRVFASRYQMMAGWGSQRPYNRLKIAIWGLPPRISEGCLTGRTLMDPGSALTIA